MNEADRKFTDQDRLALKKFLGRRYNTSDHADDFVRSLPFPDFEAEPLHPFEDINILNSESILLERFFEEHFSEPLLNDLHGEDKRMHAGFRFWQDVVEEDLFVLNSKESLECAEIVRSLTLFDVYNFARNKEEQFRRKRSQHLIGTHDFNFLSDSCRRWAVYVNIAQGAIHYENSLVTK